MIDLKNNASKNMEENKTIDIYFLRSLLGIVKDNKEELEWLLQKQNQLRIEYLTFFKKDLKEIYSNLSSLIDGKIDQKIDINEILKTVITIFREDMDKSFSIIDSRFHKTIEEEVIIRATNLIKNDINKSIEK